VYAVSGDIKTAELTTGADGTVTSGELAAGDYYLLELKAPDGYTPITDKIGVTVKAGETSAVIVYNVIMPTEPPPKATAGRIQLTKRAEGTYTLLKGAVFGVYTVSDDVKIAEMTTNAEGQAVSGELPANAYYLLELKAPDGYELNEDKTGVTVKAGETAALTVFNALKTVKPPIPTTGIMRLINKAQGTNAPLQGAVFGAYTAIGDIKTAEFTTDAEGKALSGELQPGDYYLLQHQAADGFEPAADKIGVTVKAGEVVEKVIFNAERIKTGLVRIVKRAEKTGELLPGAVFGIYNAVGDKKIAELTTGADGAATSESLPVGAYYLLEIQPPSGFTANAGRVYFTVAYDEIKEMTVTNTAEVVEKPINSYAKVITAGAGTGAKLAGAVFGLYKQGSDEKISELITGTDGAAVSAAVPEGNYYLLQLTASIGYKLNPDKINFSLNSGETKELTVINALEESPVPSGNLHLTVKAEATGAGLSGALFGIYSTLTNAKISEITTGADGAAVCELPEGSYYMRERQAPAGFIPEPSAIPFVIAAGNTIKVEVTNMGEKGGVRLTVKGADGSALAGAVLGVYNAGGMRIASLTTGADGKAITEVSAGVYYLLEESLPSGYTAGSDKYSFYVTAGQTADVLVMKQRSASPFYIPKTGEALPWLNYAAAMLCLCAAAVLAVSAARTRRRK
jgi:uncharacterized surface anchored protein